MSQYQILELNEQSTSTNRNNNGDYSVVIAPGTKLEEGDVVSLEKAFIDTSAQGSQKITIPKGGLDLNFSVGYYLQSARQWGTMNVNDGGADGYATQDGDGKTQAYLDGKTYVLVVPNATGGAFPPNATTLSKFYLKYNSDKMGPSPSERAEDEYQTGYGWAEFIFTINYTDSVGNTQQSNVSTNHLVWTTSDGGQTWNSDTLVTNVVYDRTKSLRITNVQIGKSSNASGWNNQFLNKWDDNQTTQITYQFNEADNGETSKFDGGFSVAPADQTEPPVFNVQPYTQTTEDLGLTIKVDEGQYTPTDIAAVINQGLAKNYAGDNEILKSAFLFNYKSTDADQNGSFFCAIDKQAGSDAPLAAFRITSDPQYGDGILIGASQVVLNYDTDRSQFFWQYLHTPFLGGPPPQTECVQITATSNLVSGAGSTIITRNSGIFLTDVRSTNSDGQEVFFWKNILGWNTGGDSSASAPEFCTIPRTPFTGNIRDFAVTNLHLPESLEIGRHTTSGFAGTSSVQDIRAAAPGNWWFAPTSANLPFQAFTTTTEPIFSGHADITNNTTETGYYLIEVSGVGGQGGELRSGGAYLNRYLMGIVGGFYARDSFTTGTEADSLSYVHNGPPVALEGFKVRILGPDKQLAQNLGVNNSIMLRITKSGQIEAVKPK